jgi:methyltransferase (TIGR00027 family)
MSDTPIHDISDTALWVAAFRALETKRPDAVFRDPYAEMLAGERGMAIAKEMPYPQILSWLMAVRTVSIDRLVFEAIKAGVDTVVNIGAGLDTRPYRLDLPKDLRWIEIDFPHIIESKSAKLANVTPHCKISRYGLDFSDRAAARRLYAEIGSMAKVALVITEGVVVYLSNEEAKQLALDLREVPTFRFWIKDYRGSAMKRPGRLNKKLKHSPFRFNHPDPLAFFSQFGWKVRSDIKALDEADRLHRPFPIAFPWNLLQHFVPKARREQMRQAMGYVLFEAT